MLAYILLGGLTCAIYNEVLQFFLIVFGFVPLVWLGLREVGGWDGLTARLAAGGRRARLPADALHALLARMGDAVDEPDGRGVVRARRWGSASCSRSATGAPTSSSCSARWRPTR